eukprot:scaffold7.g3435.t1
MTGSSAAPWRVAGVRIWYFSKVMSEQLGGKPYDGTWDSFVELSREIMKGRNTREQQETVAGVLAGLLPPQAPERFRQGGGRRRASGHRLCCSSSCDWTETLGSSPPCLPACVPRVCRRWFPPNKINSEVNALLTTLGFTWLVGPSELKEVEVQYEGRTEKWMSGVQIKKCRYLESSGCVGMCVNMCKIPTQRFFTETFGLPLTMEPNFEDLSCVMRFGVPPPPVEQDTVYNQPCLSPCNLGTGRSEALPCPKIDTERQK